METSDTHTDGFLQDLEGLIEENESQEVSCSSEKKERDTIKHKTSKPKWWLQLSGRRGTKAQRRTMAAMKDYALPSVPYGEFVDWNDIFTSHQDKEIWFEIGIGLGDNLLRNAQVHHDKAMVGADVHTPGVATALKRIQQAQEQGRYWDGYSLFSQDNHDSTDGDGDNGRADTAPSINDEIYSNVRIYPGNGIKLLRSIPTSSLSAVLITFPDPFPKDPEYRLLQVSTAADIHRVLGSKASLYLATDHEGHFEWCLNVMAQCQHLFVSITPVPDRPSWLPVISKYEQKGLDEGRQTRLACWQVFDKEEEECCVQRSC